MHRLRARSKKPFRYERNAVSLTGKCRFAYCKPTCSFLCEYSCKTWIGMSLIPKVGMFYSQPGNIMFPRWEFLKVRHLSRISPFSRIIKIRYCKNGREWWWEGYGRDDGSDESGYFPLFKGILKDRRERFRIKTKKVSRWLLRLLGGPGRAWTYDLQIMSCSEKRTLWRFVIAFFGPSFIS